MQSLETAGISEKSTNSHFSLQSLQEVIRAEQFKNCNTFLDNPVVLFGLVSEVFLISESLPWTFGVRDTVLFFEFIFNCWTSALVLF